MVGFLNILSDEKIWCVLIEPARNPISKFVGQTTNSPIPNPSARLVSVTH